MKLYFQPCNCTYYYKFETSRKKLLKINFLFIKYMKKKMKFEPNRMIKFDKKSTLQTMKEWNKNKFVLVRHTEQFGFYAFHVICFCRIFFPIRQKNI